MEYVEGDTLSGLLRRAAAVGGPLPIEIGMRVLLDALAGLHAAHEIRDDAGAPLRVVHRDFSPHNILVGVDGVAKLSDFGIAKATNRAGHTATGTLKGKASYMAPEQAMGFELDRRGDVWAGGVVAWELLLGRRMHLPGDALQTLLKVVSVPPERVRSERPDIHPDVDEVVARALAPMDRRWPSAQVFARELRAALEGRYRVAEPEEVAEYVTTTAGETLSVRREHLADARRGVRPAATFATPSGRPSGESAGGASITLSQGLSLPDSTSSLAAASHHGISIGAAARPYGDSARRLRACRHDLACGSRGLA
jgi:serine/threonine-protein kinase